MTDIEDTIIDKLLKNQTDNTHIQFFRYMFVGGAAFLVQFASFMIFTNININYLIATPMAFILGLIARSLVNNGFQKVSNKCGSRPLLSRLSII